MNQKLTLIAAVAVCTGTGFFVGRTSSQPDGQSSAHPNAKGPGTSMTGHRKSGAPSGPRAAGSRRVERESGTKPLRSQGDPKDLMTSIIKQPDALARGEAWLRFVKGLGVDEFEQVVSEFRGERLQRDHRGEYTMLLAAWAQVDPLAALDYATENTQTHMARQTILATWANNDPSRAIEWARSNHEGDRANPWMLGVIRGIASTNPDLATDLMKDLPRSSERYQALAALEDSYLRQGPEIARNWALSFEDESLRAGAISRIAAGLADRDPVGTADWLLENPSSGAQRAINPVMKIMAENDPQQAISYLNRITDADLRQNALDGITLGLASKDPHGALELINANPDVASHSAVDTFVRSTRSKHPELAAQAIGHIQNERHRYSAYRGHLSHWVTQDRDAAVNWMNQNPVPDEVRQMIDRYVERLDQRKR